MLVMDHSPCEYDTQLADNPLPPHPRHLPPHTRRHLGYHFPHRHSHIFRFCGQVHPVILDLGCLAEAQIRGGIVQHRFLAERAMVPTNTIDKSQQGQRQASHRQIVLYVNLVILHKLVTTSLRKVLPDLSRSFWKLIRITSLRPDLGLASPGRLRNYVRPNLGSRLFRKIT